MDQCVFFAASFTNFEYKTKRIKFFKKSRKKFKEFSFWLTVVEQENHTNNLKRHEFNR